MIWRGVVDGHGVGESPGSATEGHIDVYLPLEGVRVLDLSKLIPGDLATRKLADLGADIVKIEEPGRGDYLRLIGESIDGVGVMHWCLNRNKRSLALDVKSEEDRRILFQLMDKADAVIEVSTPGWMKEIGIDFAALRRRRPEVVVCSISGFGQTGPWAALPSHGMNMDALAGCMITKTIDGRSEIDFSLGTSIASELGAMNAALAVTAALLKARTDGRGEWIDISCWDSAVEMRRFGLVTRLARGKSYTRESASGAVLYSIYRCADDREIVFCAIEEKFWLRFCSGIDRPDLNDRWKGPKGGVDFRRNDKALREELETIFGTRDGAEWFRRFQEWQVPGCLIYDDSSLPEADHFQQRGMVEPSTPMPHIMDAVRWIDSGTRAGERAAAAPVLDADRETVLADWLGR
jgi:crotonobetainyl-CoA:carnitine CoA-transferase CaiB-like acyl-CoA transferase